MSLFLYEPFVPQRHFHFPMFDVPRFHIQPVRYAPVRYVPIYQRRSLIDEMFDELLEFSHQGFVNAAPTTHEDKQAIDQVAQEPKAIETESVQPQESVQGEESVEAEESVQPQEQVAEVKAKDLSITLPLGKLEDGVQEEHKIKVNPQTRKLTIKVTRKFESDDTKSYSSYSRSYHIPENVDVEQFAQLAKAELLEENGERVLQVQVPSVPMIESVKESEAKETEEVKETKDDFKPTRSITGDATLADEQVVDTTQKPDEATVQESDIEEVDSE